MGEEMGMGDDVVKDVTSLVFWKMDAILFRICGLCPDGFKACVGLGGLSSLHFILTIHKVEFHQVELALPEFSTEFISYFAQHKVSI